MTEECKLITPINVAVFWALQARYDCIKPAVVEGEDNSTSRCEENSKWSPLALTCRSIPCGAALSVAKSDITYSMTGLGTIVAQYTCHPGYAFDSGK